MTYKDYLKKIYYDPHHPGSFSGFDKLYRTVRKEGKYVLGKTKIRKWLETQETYGLHRQVNRKFRRRRVIVPHINYQWDIYTAVLKSYTKDNDGYGYFVLAIDVFSRYVRTAPLKSLKGTETRDALRSMIEEGSVPRKVRTDKGSEYQNGEVRRLLEEKHVEHFYTQNELKSSYAERCIKTIKSKISRYMTRNQTHRWIDILEPITQSYNSSIHRSIKMAPKKVTKKDEARLWKLQYSLSKRKPIPEGVPHRFVFKKGDTVRISHLRQPFDREYDERWTSEYFIVDSRRIKEGIPYYTLKDTMGDVIEGTFHPSELNRVAITNDTVYRVEKVLRRRRNEVLVRWMGWPSKYDSWIPKLELKDYKRGPTNDS